MGVTLLVQKEPIWPSNHLNAEELVEGPQVLQGELSAETITEL